MHDSLKSQQILTISLRTPEEKKEGLERLAELLVMAEVGLLDGLVIRSEHADGSIDYQIYGRVSAEDITNLLLFSVMQVDAKDGPVPGARS